MTDEPLLSEADAHKRAVELCQLFVSNPDALSPDEQALCMEIRDVVQSWQRALDALSEVLGEDEPEYLKHKRERDDAAKRKGA